MLLHSNKLVEQIFNSYVDPKSTQIALGKTQMPKSLVPCDNANPSFFKVIRGYQFNINLSIKYSHEKNQQQADFFQKVRNCKWIPLRFKYCITEDKILHIVIIPYNELAYHEDLAKGKEILSGGDCKYDLVKNVFTLDNMSGSYVCTTPSTILYGLLAIVGIGFFQDFLDGSYGNVRKTVTFQTRLNNQDVSIDISKSTVVKKLLAMTPDNALRLIQSSYPDYYNALCAYEDDLSSVNNGGA